MFFVRKKVMCLSQDQLTVVALYTIRSTQTFVKKTLAHTTGVALCGIVRITSIFVNVNNNSLNSKQRITCTDNK
jgi:hypothetical protein